MKNITDLKMDFPGVQTFHTDEEISIIADAIKSPASLSMGKYLKTFEDQFSEYLGVKHAFGLSSATAALDLSAILSGAGAGDEILVPAHTFAASALPFLRSKSKLVFVDIDPESFVMDLNDLKRKITSKSKVVVPVHLYGLPINMTELMAIAKENSLFVIEDCAQAPGATWNGKKVGSFGDLGCFSFHGQKNITTLGEGGMLVTNNPKFEEKILGLRKIGARPYDKQEKYWRPAMSNIIEAIPGQLPFNFAMGEIQALAGSLILKRIDDINSARKSYFNRINNELMDYTELQFQKITTNSESAYHLLPARYNGKDNGKRNDNLIEDLYIKFGIKCVVQYYPLYNYELFINNGYSIDKNACPKSDDFFDNMISFPFKSEMTSSELDYLISSIKNVLNSFRNS
jgi:perosamine synthetase